MSSSYGKGGKFSQGSSQKSNHMQKQILDQHYSNSIIMTILSTLESMQFAYNKMSVSKEQKFFGYYDKVEYKDKNYAQLKSQLQVQLGVLKASRHIFDKEHSKGKYTMPANFDENELKAEIRHFQTVFKGDIDLIGMLNDLKEISQGNTGKQMYYEAHDFTVQYSKEEAEKYKKETFGRGIHAADQMDIQKNKIEQMEIEHPRQIPVFLNKKTQHNESRQQYHSGGMITGFNQHKK